MIEALQTEGNRVGFDALHIRHKEQSCLPPLALTELGYHLHEPHDQPTHVCN